MGSETSTGQVLSGNVFCWLVRDLAPNRITLLRELRLPGERPVTELHITSSVSMRRRWTHRHKVLYVL